MRRARLKVQATVPIRRKLQEQAKADDSNNLPSDADKQSLHPPSNESISNSNFDGGKSANSISISNTNTDNKQNESEKSANSVVETENDAEITIELHNMKQEFVENIEQSRKIEISQDNNKIENSNNIQIINEPNDSNNETEKQITANRDDNVDKNQSDQDTQETLSSHVEVNSSKQIANRSCFMRPVPRLDSGGRIRKNSIQGSGASASESEDDSRKSSSTPMRVRNDSICSVQSNKELSSGAHNISKIKVGQQKRRLTVSESAKKLADARREFMLKHENKTPDRTKLTMYDLIYYNPVTNPMTRSENSAAARKMSVSSNAAEDQQENDDEEEEEEEEEEQPTAMPVPRVKVGPDGQLIVDEKSLIIERTEQKNRSGPIVHDETNGGGFYKRRQKSKDWSKWDTLRFYKALSNIGTDFLLMQRFFPKRTRQELKLKFKKEEKTNRQLIEQALKCQVFDQDLLKEEMEIFAENERKEAEALKMKTEVAKKQKSKRPSKCRFVIGSIEELGNSGDEDIDGDLSSGESRNEDSQKKSRRTRRKRKSLNSLSVYDETNESSSDTEDMEIYNVKPTRSGRLPKRRKLQAPNIESSDYSDADESKAQESELKNTPETERSESQSHDIISNVIPNMKDIEPGSLVIITRESPGEPGKTVVQVYMVSKDYNANDPNSEQNMTPVDLSPELLATVNSKISEAQPVHVKSQATNVNE
ncbi:transcription factor TFIIIB component B'' homolog [Leptopilina heterotoma]|uniref:transcription factor TFIIIB component B'' homolog n=1 Tax=Leptopilina heterotoma TaxID=63436 RepID=UPI001CA9DE17|nr:transcription factor TFIIIB component B'' homolog [Leptopilina heterotoma]XP_043472958.1 transcription factor TFIIIB component B'' homolog [Leptopilina heterotoma]